MCSKNGAQLADGSELLFRQVRPTWFDDEGHPSSQNFRPGPLDDGCLSTDRDSTTTAHAAYNLFSAAKPAGFGGQSDGVWAVSLAEVHIVGLTAWEAPLAPEDGEPANPHHVAVEFGDLKNKPLKRAGDRLKVFAYTRGRLHPFGEPP